MATLRLFASAREAAGTGRAIIDGDTVGDILDAAVVMFGTQFADVLTTCRVWINGDEADRTTPASVNDEVAVLPPVSGGCR
jgi:sulfur-carrier protein